ncbi:MAG: TonB-dependent receptor plug domain-containing protein, partial [Melioribacteraceae bacterium]|nr:TonB-dependent receptor plug domain-containing protein [Melioribacteraceae bacterium]
MQKIFIILLLLVSVAYSQKRIQIVDSSSKESISDVVIHTSSLQLISDSNGYFLLNEFSKTDLISFSHIAYKKITLNYSELKLISTVELTKKDFATEQVEVISKKDYENSIISEKIELNQYEQNRFASTAEILKSQTSLLVRDYGGEASTKTISSRGMSSENTLVLFNEARVNDLRTGTFDFSLIDLFAIDKIEYVKNNSADNITAG